MTFSLNFVYAAQPIHATRDGAQAVKCKVAFCPWEGRRRASLCTIRFTRIGGWGGRTSRKSDSRTLLDHFRGGLGTILKSWRGENTLLRAPENDLDYFSGLAALGQGDARRARITGKPPPLLCPRAGNPLLLSGSLAGWRSIQARAAHAVLT